MSKLWIIDQKDMDLREMEKEVILADKGMLTDRHMLILLIGRLRVFC